MGLFLTEALQTVNLPYTVLMLVVAIYWLSVIVGVLDFDFLDIEIEKDFDLGMGVDIDADVDADVDADAGGGGFGKVLYFFNIGSLPFMIIFSFLMFFMWSMSVFANHYLGNSSWLIALLLFFPIFIVGLFMTKFATIPFVKMFAAMSKDTDVEVVGKECILMESADYNSIAHGKVTNAEGLVQMVNVKTMEKGVEIPKGAKALIVQFDEKKRCYLVEEVH